MSAPLKLQKLGCKQPFFSAQHKALFPCGKCLVCRSRRARQWTHRLALESTDWAQASHITLTYREFDIIEETDLFDHTRNFHYEDIQLFNKRLRKALDSRGYGKIKFFCAGERGEQGTQRVHWHILYFGVGKSAEVEEIVKSCWSYGRICHKKVANKSGMKKVSAYVSQYVLKKIGDKKDAVQHGSQGLGLKAAMRLFRDTLMQQFQKFGDFQPIVWNGEKIRLDRYLKYKIAESLGILEELKSRWKLKLQDFLEEVLQIYETYSNRGVRPSVTDIVDDDFYSVIDTYPEFPRFIDSRFNPNFVPVMATYRQEFRELHQFINEAWDFVTKDKYETYEKIVLLRQLKNNRGFFTNVTKKVV